MTDLSALSHDERQLIEALRSGDEAAFVALVERYHNTMLRVAMLYVSDSPTAEDVVQETWVGVLRGLDRFEGRSSLKTWIFTILTNRAKTRAGREGRYVPLSTLWSADLENDRASVSEEHFHPQEHPRAGHWSGWVSGWDDIPEERLLSQETLSLIQQTITLLPSGQREVIRLRDLEGWSAAEVCNVLEISETNQRVLLHRARAKVRAALDHYLKADP